jgi:hypothetical protein
LCVCNIYKIHIMTINTPDDILNNKHTTALEMQSNHNKRLHRVLFDMFNLSIGIIIPIMFIYKVKKIT